MHYVKVICDSGEKRDGLANGCSRDKPVQLDLWIKLEGVDRVVRSPFPPRQTHTADGNKVRSSERIANLFLPTTGPGERPNKKHKSQSLLPLLSLSELSLSAPGPPQSSQFVVAAAPLLEPVDARPVLSLQTLLTGYLIYSTDWQQPLSTSTGATAVPAPSGLDDFLGALVTGFLMLEAGPPTTTTTTTRGSSSSSFLEADEWASWMIESVGASSLSAVWNSSSGVLEGFAVQFKVPLDIRFVTTTTILGSPDPVTLAFGLLNAGIMVFGLELPPGAALDCTLEQVLDFTGFPSSRLFGLASSIGLVLDMSAGNRNAVWFWPDVAYETTIRLQFTLNPSDALTVSSFVNKTLNTTQLTITDVKVIARQVAHAQDLDTEQNIQLGSELILSMTVSEYQGYLVFDEGYVTVIIHPPPALTFKDGLAWVVGLLGVNPEVVESVMDWLPVSLLDIRVAQIKIQASDKGVLLQFSIDVQMDMPFGKDPGVKVPFLVSLFWPPEICYQKHAILDIADGKKYS